MRRIYSAIPCAVIALAWSWAAPAQAPEAVDAIVYFDFPSHYSWTLSRQAPPHPLPMDLWAKISSIGIPSVEDAPRDGSELMWVYANETGKVRALARTSSSIPIPPGYPDPSARHFSSHLIWQKTFTKSSADDTATFTVNPSTVQVNLPGAVPVRFNRDFVWAYISMGVTLLRHDLEDLEAGQRVNEFSASVELSPIASNSACHLQLFAPRQIWSCESGYDRGHNFGKFDAPLYVVPVLSGHDYVVLATEPYHGNVDLSAVPVGQKYTVQYSLTATAATVVDPEAGNLSEAYIGDPLDIDSGFDFDTTSVPAPDDGQPLRLCDVEIDELRYTDHGDGSVTDTYTGLMWQRCPTGYSLNGSATPGDVSDDRCAVAGETNSNWQAALQQAANDTGAEHADWRLPNVKELESIVELGCQWPAIEIGPFPDAPAELFWSSTPARDADAAMGVHFLDGRIDSEKKTASAWVRLVRTAAQPPVQPLPALRIGQPIPVEEGDSGNTDIRFPVSLDRPAMTDVTVHYQTEDDLAHVDEDYQNTSGTLVIAAGSTTAQVSVPIMGDTIGEADETFYLALDNVSANARLVVITNLGTIADDEPMVELAPSGFDVDEGDSGNAELTFAITLSKPSLTDTTFDYATADGTATGDDYTSAAGTLTIPAGQTDVLAQVDVTGDTAVEGDEHLSLTLTNVSANARPGNATAQGLILEDDVEPGCEAGSDPAAGVLRFSLGGYLIAEQSGVRPNIAVERTGGSAGVVQVTVTTSDDTAAAGADYTPVSTTITFADGDTAPRFLAVPIVDDAIAEPDEFVDLKLSEPGGCATLGLASAVLTIRDDQTVPSYTIGGTVTGLIGTGLVLRDLQFLPITPGNGAFTFSLPTRSGSPYAVTVVTQPNNPAQICSVTNGSGTVTDANITNVAVDCAASAVNGALDADFGSGGKVTTGLAGGATAMALQSDGKLVLLGKRTLARYNIDGSVDTSFGTGGQVSIVFNGGLLDEAQGLAMQPDGKIVVVGFTRGATHDDFAVARYNIDGTLDASFGTGGKASADISDNGARAWAALIQPDGSIVVAGHASINSPLAGHDFAVVRFTPEGAPDTSFGTAGKAITDIGGRTDLAVAAALQADGKIVLAGRVDNSSRDVEDFGLARYNADGSLDTGFGANGIVRTHVSVTDFGDQAKDLVIQGDGKILVAGSATVESDATFGNSTGFALLRFNANGSPDTGFGSNGVVTTLFSTLDDFGHGVALQGDGRIVVVGESSNQMNPDFGVARYNADGTPDTSFGADGRLTVDFFGKFDGARDVAIQADGKIVVVGSAVNVTTTGLGLVRINP